jgi:hypothetical protein
MVDIKEISNIKIVPFTLMSSTISAILAFIFGIIIALFLGIAVAFLPSPLWGILAGLGIALIIAYPILVFLIGLSTVFLSILLYNWLVPRVGGVKLALEGNQLISIPIIPFALILSIIAAIWMFIIGLILATGIAPVTGLIGTAIPLIANATNTSFTGAAFGAGTAILYVSLIIILPIATFIAGFISTALFAIFYNYIAVRAAKIQLNFGPMTEKWNMLSSIPIVPAALAISIVFAIFGFIRGLILLIGLASVGNPVGGIVQLIASTIIYFILYLIIVAIATALYNRLAPRIGAIKLELT